MKRFWSIFALLTITAVTVFAQNSNPNQDAIRESQKYCPGLFNPTKFKIQGQNPASASWQGYGGGQNYGNTGKLGHSASSCGNWDMTFGKGPATGAQIDAARPNLSTEPSSWIFYGSYGACGYNSTPQDLSHKRFRIMDAGTDPLTINPTTHIGLSQVPEGDPDTTFSHSIRLGNHCGGGQQAEKLIYQFKVRPQNAMLILYYALSLEDARHESKANPEFVIEVQLGEQTASTISTDLNTYNYTTIGNQLFYGQPTPEQGAPLAPFKNGGAGSNGSEENVYLPWNKVVINLGAYLNKAIRICIGTGDCAYSVHYAYSYIAGYCRPMKMTVAGCPLNEGNVVSTLQAPYGLKDPSYTSDPNYHAYQWYRCNDPSIDGDQIEMSVDDDWFNANFSAIPGANDSVYHTLISDYQLNGQILESRAFACVMTTYMNRTTNAQGVRQYPIKSRIFANAKNEKPQVQMEQLATCDGKIDLKSSSYCGREDYIIDSLISWEIYDNANCVGNRLDSLTGKNVKFQSSQAGSYWAKMHVPTNDQEKVCYAEKVFEITSIESPRANPTVSNSQPCVGDEIDLIDRSERSNNREWRFSDGTTSTDSTLSKSFTLSNDTIQLIATNHFNCSDTNITVVHVFTSPDLEISDDTIVCEGQKTNVTIKVKDDDPNATYDYEWFRHLDRPGDTPIQTGNVLKQIPDANAPTSTYYVKVIRQPQGCIAWDSVTVHVVRPTLQMIPSDGKICPGEKAKLIAGNAHHYSWTASPNDTTLAALDSNTTTIYVSPSSTTTYTLIGHGSDDCNADPLNKTVTIIPTPIPRIEISPDFVDSEEPIVTFKDLSQHGVSSKWDFGDGQTSNERQVSHTFSNVSLMDYVTVNLTSYNTLGNRAPGCYDTTSVNIPIQLFSVWIPNAFTPTLADNKTFGIVTANILEYFSVRIFDRHGQLVYYSTDQKFQWNGTYKGTVCPQGSYVYVIRYRRPGTIEITERKGTLTLLR